MPFSVIDAHAHCGQNDPFPPQAFEDYLAEVKGTDIAGVVMFAPVMEVYDRYDAEFVDTAQWQERRRQANQYILDLDCHFLEVFPFFFIWNDFAVEQLSDRHRGIKWHRHAGEPPYLYDDPRCRTAIDEIRRRKLPVCFEEEWHHTIRFIDEIGKDLRIIIPHCGLLNGGFERFCKHGIWNRPNIFTDTSLVPSRLIKAYLNAYGHKRIMFGSDFPFGDPMGEYRKIVDLDVSPHVRADLLGGNARRLLAVSVHSSERETEGP